MGPGLVVIAYLLVTILRSLRRVLLGLGLYLPYVAVHTTVFERLIALTRDRGNLGYLMYLADAAGYLGYAAVMLAKDVQVRPRFRRALAQIRPNRRPAPSRPCAAP